MTNLARGSFVGMAAEPTPGTYQIPAFSVPWTKADYETVQAPIRDESIRNNDAVLQGLYAGPSESTFAMDLHGYPDILGYFLRILGPDTVTPATSTTLSAATIVGATSISTAATIPAGTTIRIDTTTKIEYAVTGTPSGAGPFTIPLLTAVGGTALALAQAHSSGATVTTQTTHTFKQSLATRPPAWSLSVWDTVDYRGFPGSQLSEVQLKIDPKAALSLSAKFTGFPEQVVASFTPAYNTMQPVLGWQWAMTTAGAANTRGLTLDLTAKRTVEAIHSSDGTQGPREVFPGALELDGSYKAIYENVTDMGLFLNYSQQPVVAALTKPASAGGESLTVTMSQAGVPKSKRDLGQQYVQASYDLSAIANTTDTGIAQVVLKNWITTTF